VTENSGTSDPAVVLRDLRFEYPEFRGRITLSATVRFDRDLHVVAEKFGSKEQNPPLD
jgi:hypothetical protein